MRAALYLLFTLAAVWSSAVSAQDSHRITVTIDGYEEEIISLANNVLDKQYIVDTAYRNDAGNYVFESDTAALPGGIYLVVMAPDNNYFQVLINNDDQEFSLKTSIDDLSDVKVKGSKDNELFFSYLEYLDGQQEKGATAQQVLADSSATEAQKKVASDALTALDEEVKAYQEALIEKNPTTFTAKIVKTNLSFPPPDFPELADEEERREAQFRWLQAHYLDPLDLRDDRLLRTPFLIQRIEYFVDRLHVQHPDSVSAAIDQVLARMDPQSELYKYYVVHFTNRAASSKIVGRDAVYVHMVDKYYASGKAYWADPDQLKSMLENVEKLRPILIGEQAPDLKMKTRDGQDVTLYGTDAKYTILYFWAFDCGHCKKSTPVIKDFYAKWKPRGVEIFSICTKQSKIEKCWEYIDEKEIGDWMHVTDKYLRFYKNYDIKSTPTIFVLDENKKIISKKIGAEQLDTLLEMFERQDTNEEERGDK
ncbi:TlpA disulfide reductase family protein [Lewinella sp. 4G2]|uniref:TlpA disulfide reductase family protein n=1 Tax=Lewinella sp. 4G2 TaxID=1803372 RepID=UPI0007B4ABC2|nr:TlpA disulfide reductase family protein [Lewinella sp. 4G2]OAV44805.1 hypothetical protein A3850_010030 [Lewinella sp. 4G2]